MWNDINWLVCHDGVAGPTYETCHRERAEADRSCRELNDAREEGDPPYYVLSRESYETAHADLAARKGW